MLRLSVIVLALAGCATPRGPWKVVGAESQDEEAQALQIVEAAKRVTPDEKGWLAMGGTIWLMPDVRAECPVPPGYTPTGCSWPGKVWVLVPHPSGGRVLYRSALPHELCHLGLERGGGMLNGPVIIPNDVQSDACAKLIVNEVNPQ